MPAPYDNMSATSLRMPSFSQQSIAPSHQNASSNILPWTSHQRGSISARQEYIPEASAQPRLVRTSTLEAFRAPMAHSASGGYYQQQMKPPQARLKFAESLEAFGRPDRWSEEHLRAGRRVMYFFRKQQGAEVVLRFRVANADEVGGGGSTRPQHSVAVSCILWQQQRQCFVTSVDTIMLLEHIIGYKFPTEEKNRIRRNLEHFKPITVKKPVPGGPSSQIRSGEKEMDTTELFSTIMSFGAPKPRNIEKDIKVFQWRDLAKALQKIVSKYVSWPFSTLDKR